MRSYAALQLQHCAAQFLRQPRSSNLKAAGREATMDINTLYNTVLEGEVARAEADTVAALERGLTAQDVLDEALVPAMREVGRLFENGEYFLPEMLAAGLAMKSCMKVLGPALAARGETDPKARIVLGTVKGDVHDIGKNIVGVMLEGSGFSVTDLGVDVSRERFVAAAEDADIIGLSALVSTTIPEMRCVIEALKNNGLRDRIKVMVGGAPVTERFAQEIGADGYAKDAASAVRVAEELIGA